MRPAAMPAAAPPMLTKAASPVMIREIIFLGAPVTRSTANSFLRSFSIMAKTAPRMSVTRIKSPSARTAAILAAPAAPWEIPDIIFFV